MGSVLSSFVNGFKFDVSRTFLMVLLSFFVMFSYAAIDLNAGNYGRFILYTVFLYYMVFHIQGLELFKDFKQLSISATTITDFKVQYSNYSKRDDYLKLRGRAYALFGWATLDLYWIFKAIFV